MPVKNREGDFTLDELQHPTTSLAKHYHDKLPMRGWAGRFNQTEKEYVRLVKKRRLTNSPRVINALKSKT